MKPDRTLLELMRPPEGYHLETAILLTHDLNGRVLTHHVLPALAGEVAKEPAHRLGSIARLPIDGVTVAYAADRGTDLTLLPSDCLTLVPVIGRRQHAKLHVLRFTRHQGKGPRTRWRVVVTSANLTQGGLRTNHEVLAVDEIASNDLRARPSLLPASLDAIKTLAASATALRQPLTSALGRLRPGVPANLTSAEIFHSLGTPNPILAALGHGPYNRLLLCAPTFSGGNGGLAGPIGALLSRSAVVDIVVPATLGPTRRGTAVPSGLVKTLADHGHTVNLHEVPLLDGDDRQRRLHGKQYVAARDDGSGVVVVGSANLTRRGLLGENRELAVVVEHANASAAADSILTDLGVKPVLKSEPASTQDEDLPSEVLTEPYEVEFTPLPGSSPVGRVHGHLGDSSDPPLRVDSKRVRPGALVWLESTTLVEAKPTSKWVTAAVVVRAEDEDEFWDNVRRDDAHIPTDPLLRKLVGDLRRTGKAEIPTGTPTTAGDDDGRFDLPAVLWLNVVARHRKSLCEWTDELAAQVGERLDPGPERRVALALIGRSEDDEDELLGLLTACADRFGR